MRNNIRPVRHNGLQCYGDGFTFASHTRADTATIVEALQSAGSTVKSARISKNQKIKRKKSWWSAQARLYGLRGSDLSIGTCKELFRKALEKGPLEVPQKLKDAEARANKEYANQGAKVGEMEEYVARARDNRYRAATTDENRVNVDAKRFLREKFDGDVDFVVLRGMRHNYYNLVKSFNLCEADTPCEDESDGRILVIGRDDCAVRREIEGIKDEVEKERAANQKAKLDEFEELRQELIKSGDGGNPSGRWVLHMPEYVKAHCFDFGPGDKKDFGLDIPRFEEEDESIYAKFGFVAFSGWFKINFGEPKGSWLGAKMEFEWDGYEEAMRSSIVLDERDWNTGSITFTSASKCHGTITGWFGGPFDFIGFKVSSESCVSASKCKEDYEERTEYMNSVRKEQFGSDSESIEEDG